MSHFTVLVVTRDQEPETLKKALHPFHEYECTGDLAFTEWVDATEEVESGWANLSDEDKEKDYGSSISQYAEDYYGYDTINEEGKKKFGRITNPNRKWDWWMIGGRWEGSLTDINGHVLDSCRFGDLDLELMKSRRVADRREVVDRAAKDLGFSTEKFTEIWDRHKPTFDRLTAEWNGDRNGRRWDFFAENLSEEDYDLWQRIFDSWRGISGDERCSNIKEYVENVEPLSTFAILDLEGNWHEKGSMGWWGMVIDEQEDWGKVTFKDLLSKIEPDHFVTVVDCHI